MDIRDQFELYEKTVKRLERLGIHNPLAQIIYLAAEIEQYRENIHALEDEITRLKCGPTVEE